MILRRIATAFRRQDWFTVLIEMLIVIFGVYLGLIFNDVRETRDRAHAAQESLLLLLDDLEGDINRIELVRSRQQVRIDAFTVAIAELAKQTPSYELIAEKLAVGVAHNQTLYARDTIYDVMEADGLLVAIPDELKEMIRTIYGSYLPMLAEAGLQLDQNTYAIDAQCFDVYWDRELKRPISEEPTDLRRLSNCFVNMRDTSQIYSHGPDGERLAKFYHLRDALREELGVTTTNEQVTQ
ncbi:hypothetical protein [Hyphococcus lacteus]|uniref:Uncharacterized protein n=1 Tax=Hyphococcus lacteus TaxID=3143536 RepID=A0ABV3Z150_9PROT